MSSLVRTATRDCLKVAHVSVRRAPKLWGCSKATVERDLRRGYEIRPLRHPRTAECFARRLLELVTERDAKHARPAGYVVRAHGRKVASLRGVRKLSKRAARKGAR